MGRMKKYTFIIVAAVILLTAGGVSATWQYAISPANSGSADLPVSCWEWSELPPVVPGEDHGSLIESVVDGILGLNTPDSPLDYAIDDMISKAGGKHESLISIDANYNLGGLIDNRSAALTFLVYFPDITPDVRYLFTTAVDLGEPGKNGNNIPYGETVYPVYRTRLNLVGEKWVQGDTVIGSAPSREYDNWGGANNKTPSIDVANFREGVLGDKFVSVSDNNAILTYLHRSLPEDGSIVGLNGMRTTTALSNGNAVYYRFDAAGARTLCVKDLAAEIVIYDAQGGIITPTIDESNPEFKKYTFTATDGTNYIKITGGGTVTFTLY